ncbi:hypothetical protein JXA88_02230 [Candidatus Fermentibacteria bacterium]|nr:hypothetical protein [Candidatus Fermentibacteria bacterium]
MKAQCILMGCGLLVVYSLFFTFSEGWNGQSRWALSLALARRGTTAVDEFIGESRDVSVSGGRLYAAKAPGMGILGAPVVWLGDRIVAPGDPTGDAAKRLLVRVILVSVPAAMLAVLLCMAHTPSAALTAAACCVASPVLPYATLFYGHVPSALCLMAAWMLAREKRHLWAGVVAGLGCAIDYLTALGIVGVVVLVALEDRRGAVRLVFGMLPGAALVAGYNLASFGTPLATGYENLADEGFAEAMSHGYRGIGAPALRTLVPMLFGTYRGLFLLSPWLLLWPVAALKLRSRHELIMTVAVPVFYLVLLSGFPAWWGGASCTVRHAIIVLPLMAWAVGTLGGRWRRLLLVLAAMSWVAQIGFTATEPEMPEDVAFPLAHFVVPRILAGRFRGTVLGAGGIGQAVALALAVGFSWGVLIAAWRMRRELSPDSAARILSPADD